MNNYIFTANNGTQYKRIDKRQAKKLYDTGATIVACPCNLKPFGFWHSEVEINKSRAGDSDFKRVINDFEYYNCINSETGNYTAFYVEF